MLSSATILETSVELSRLAVFRVKLVGCRCSLPSILNKTKYFRLRLSDEVGTERPETDLRLT